MRLLGLKTFRHGVHPPESKDRTSGLAIRRVTCEGGQLLMAPIFSSMLQTSWASFSSIMLMAKPMWTMT